MATTGMSRSCLSSPAAGSQRWRDESSGEPAEQHKQRKGDDAQGEEELEEYRRQDCDGKHRREESNA